MTDIETLRKSFQKRNFYTTKESGSVFLWALVVPLLVGFAFCYITMFIAMQTGAIPVGTKNIVTYMYENFLWFAVIFVMLTQLCFVAIYFCFHKFNRISFKATRVVFKKVNWKTILICIMLGIVCVVGMIALIENCFGGLWRIIGLKQSSAVLPLNTWGWYVLNILLLGVLPAIAEELLFRGMIFQGLKDKFGRWPSILLSALLFALIHQNIEQFIYPFLLGIVFALVFERTGNLLYSMIIHLFNNVTTITITFLMNLGVLSLDFALTWWFVLIAIALAGVVVGIVFLVDKFYLQKHQKIEIEKEGEVVQARSINLGKFPLTMVIGAVFAVIMVVINALG